MQITISNLVPSGGTGGHVQCPFIGVQHEYERKHQITHMAVVPDNQARVREVHNKSEATSSTASPTTREACVHHMLGNGFVFQPLLSPWCGEWNKASPTQTGDRRRGCFSMPFNQWNARMRLCTMGVQD